MQGVKQSKKNVYRRNKIENKAIFELQKNQTKEMEKRQKIDITLSTVKNNLKSYFERYELTASYIISSKFYKNSGTGREEFCVTEKTCYYITYEPKTEKILLLQIAFQYPETKEQINDFRNHICLFLGMVNQNANLNDVDDLLTGLNIMSKNTPNITIKHFSSFLYKNYMYYLHYNSDNDIIFITLKGVS